jgi:hypothetical protein
MLTLQSAQSGIAGGQGCLAAVRAELQADPSIPRASSEVHRQRLLELAGRLARVQALGCECARVGFSPEIARQVRQVS